MTIDIALKEIRKHNSAAFEAASKALEAEAEDKAKNAWELQFGSLDEYEPMGHCISYEDELRFVKKHYGYARLAEKKHGFLNMFKMVVVVYDREELYIQ